MLCVGQFRSQNGVVEFELPIGLPEVPNFLVFLGRFDCDCFDFLVTGSAIVRARGGPGCFVLAAVAHKALVRIADMAARVGCCRGSPAVYFQNSTAIKRPLLGILKTARTRSCCCWFDGRDMPKIEVNTQGQAELPTCVCDGFAKRSDLGPGRSTLIQPLRVFLRARVYECTAPSAEWLAAER